MSSNLDADRTKRIRDAKSEAQKEIEEYKNQKEEEFKKFEAEVRSAYSTSRYQPRYRRLTRPHSIRADSKRTKKMRTKKLRRSSRRSRMPAARRAIRLLRISFTPWSM